MLTNTKELLPTGKTYTNSSYSIRAEVFARLCRNFTGISGYSFFLHIQSNQYYLWVKDKNSSDWIYFCVTELQFQYANIGIELTTEFIEDFKTASLKLLVGDMTFTQLENNKVDVTYRDVPINTFSVWSAPQLVETKSDATISVDTWNCVVSMLEQRRLLKRVYVRQDVVYGIYTLPIMLATKPVIGDLRTAAVIRSPKLVYDLLSKLKISGSLSVGIEEGGNFFGSIGTIKTSKKEIVDFTWKYFTDEVELESVDGYDQLIKEIKEKGNVLDVNPEKLNQALLIFEQKGYKENTLCVLTATTKIKLKLFKSLFSDRSDIQEVRVWEDKLYVTYSSDAPDVLTTLYRLSDTLKKEVLDVDSGTDTVYD